MEIKEADKMLNVKYAGFGGYMEVPCYEDEKGKIYFDVNNGAGGLNLYTGAYRNEEGEIVGESDTKVTDDVECEQPFVRHARENDYRMLGRLKSDCEYFLNFGAGREDVLYYENVEEQCNAMEKIWNSFEDNDKPEWITPEQIQEYRDRMNQKLKENGLSSYVEGLSDALDETNRMLSGISEKNVMESATNVSEKINEYKNEQMTLPLSNFEFDDEDGYLHFTVTADDYELEGLFRIHDPENGSDMELVSIDYGYLYPVIEQQWSSIEEMLKQVVMQREMTDVKADIETEETESEYEEISSPHL